MPAMDVMTQGRMAMIADPSGAVFGVWEPRDHQGAEVFNEPGSLTWNELQTRDLAAAMPFYAEVFGWRWEEMPDSGGYQVAHLDAKERSRHLQRRGDDHARGRAARGAELLGGVLRGGELRGRPPPWPSASTVRCSCPR